MSFFDFSDEVNRARREAKDNVSRWCARTTIGRKRFPEAVARAGWHHFLVIGVATWSDPDLCALEKLVVDVRGRDVKILVFDVDDWPSPEIAGPLPGVARFMSTPVVAQYRDEVLTFQGEGRDAILWLDQF